MPFPSVNNDKVNVARNGSILGIYDLDKLADMLETGRFLPTDHYYDDSREAWIPLSSLAESTPGPSSREFKQVKVKSESDSSSKESSRSGSGRRSSRAQAKAKKRGENALGGWIACLFALGAAAGLWAYAQHLSDQLTTANDKLKDANHTVESLRRENQLLTEVTPAGRIRGIITYEPTANQVAIMSGATVGLYQRSDVEKALAGVSPSNNAIGAEGFESAIERLKAAISSPLEISLTDSNGRLDMTVPKPGNYVLVASAAKSTAAGTERYFWLIGFTASDQPSGLVLLNESNAISTRKPRFVITDVRSIAAGLESPQALP